MHYVIRHEHIVSPSDGRRKRNGPTSTMLQLNRLLVQFRVMKHRVYNRQILQLITSVLQIDLTMYVKCECAVGPSSSVGVVCRKDTVYLRKKLQNWCNTQTNRTCLQSYAFDKIIRLCHQPEVGQRYSNYWTSKNTEQWISCALSKFRRFSYFPCVQC